MADNPIYFTPSQIAAGTFGGGASRSGAFGTGFNANSGINPAGSVQGGAIKADVASGGDLTDLMKLIDSLGVSGQQQANAGRIPGATALETQSSKVIGDELSGNLPKDVIDLIGQQGAEWGLKTGGNAIGRDLLKYLGGSLGQIQTGQQNLTAAEARNPGANLTPPSYFLPGGNSLRPVVSGNAGILPGSNIPGTSNYNPGNGNISSPDNSWWDNYWSQFSNSPTAVPNPVNPGVPTTDYSASVQPDQWGLTPEDWANLSPDDSYV